MQTKLKNIHPLVALFAGIAAYILLPFLLGSWLIEFRRTVLVTDTSLRSLIHILPGGYSLRSWVVGFPMCLLSFACVFFLSGREQNGERPALKYFGVIAGIFCLMEGWHYITVDMFPSPFIVYSDHWQVPVFYSSALLSPVAILVGNGGFKRRRALYTCPQCGLVVRAAKNARIICADCGVPFEPAGRKAEQASVPAGTGQAAAAPFA